MRQAILSSINRTMNEYPLEHAQPSDDIPLPVGTKETRCLKNPENYQSSEKHSKLGIILHGSIVHSLNTTHLQVIQTGIIGVSDTGIILFLEQSLTNIGALKDKYRFEDKDITQLETNSFLLPGLIDTHIHAPQYTFTGTGYDLGLLEWLQKYTFPREAEFSDSDFALAAYTRAVKRSVRCGTTTACYYATIHLNATKVLANVIESAGQRALVGKVNMNMNSPDWYIESTTESIASTLEFIRYVQDKNNPLLHPVLTPRFAPSCSIELMTKLGEISKEFGLMIQTHISETCAECAWVSNLFPQSSGYADVYHKSGLLNNQSIMAHCIYLTKHERDLFREVGAGISHCPNSNFMLQSGILNVRQLFNEGFQKIGLGTDVSGGFSASILDSMRMAVIASKALNIVAPEAPCLDSATASPLSYKEAIYLATLGGAKVLNLDRKIGNFEVGKEFDALVISLNNGAKDDRPVDVFPHDTLDDLVEKFVYLGDDRNITSIYIAGKLVVV